jgi:hypothetical protein
MEYFKYFLLYRVEHQKRKETEGENLKVAVSRKLVASLTRLPMTTNVSDISYRPARTPSSTSTIDNKCTDNPLLNRIHPTSISYGAHRDPIQPLIHRIATSETLTEKARQQHLQSATKGAQLQRSNEYGSSDPVEKNRYCGRSHCPFNPDTTSRKPYAPIHRALRTRYGS